MYLLYQFSPNLPQKAHLDRLKRSFRCLYEPTFISGQKNHIFWGCYKLIVKQLYLIAAKTTKTTSSLPTASSYNWGSSDKQEDDFFSELSGSKKQVGIIKFLALKTFDRFILKGNR